MMKKFWQWTAGLLCLFGVLTAQAATLKSAHVEVTPKHYLALSLQFSDGLPEMPKVFSTQMPAPSVVLDFHDLPATLTHQALNRGPLKQLTVFKTSKRTRVVIDLKEALSSRAYHLTRDEKANRLVLTFNTAVAGALSKTQAHTAAHKLLGVDFQGSAKKGGKVILTFSDDAMSTNLARQDKMLNVTLFDTQLPKHLQKRFDVSDFATVVDAIDVKAVRENVQVMVHLSGEARPSSYQIGSKFIIKVPPVVQSKKAGDTHFGKPISMNVQHIDIAAALQMLAQFSGKNIMVSDGVTGKVTLEVKDRPWDQVLEMILSTKGLGKIERDGVIMVAPDATIQAQKQKEQDAAEQIELSGPLHTKLIRLSYAKAGEVSSLLKSKEEGQNAVLSKRGSVAVDKRTNTLWIRDVDARLAAAEKFIQELDIPVRQVMIKARIVTVDTGYEHELGVRFGLTRSPVTGSLAGSELLRVAGTPVNPIGASVVNRLNFNLPATGEGVGSIGVALANLGRNTFLDLELSALESENAGKVVASPTLMTSDQQEASIKQGIAVPYISSTGGSSGTTTIQFKDAVLQLKVTPRITPDDHLVLTLAVNQDTLGQEVLGTPAINKREINTEVLVNNGETLVLGGIYEQRNSNQVTRVPFFGSLPVVGQLFRQTIKKRDRRELLIFITPKIIKQAMTEQVGSHA